MALGAIISESYQTMQWYLQDVFCSQLGLDSFSQCLGDHYAMVFQVRSCLLSIQ